MKRRVLCTVLVVLAVLLLVPNALAASVTPTFVAGNPSCVGLRYGFGFKPQPEPPPTGTYSDGYLTVNISSDGTYFDWSSSTISVDAVIVKGGPNANVYAYSPESFGDTALSAPINNDSPFGISHIEFCYDFELTATKTATTSFHRDYSWTINKYVDPAAHVGFPGQTFQSAYDVVVDQSFVDSNFVVSGNITVTNPSPITVNFSVTDSVGGTNASVNCPSASVGAGQSVVCTYSATLGTKTDGTNTATITSSTNGVSGTTASAGYAFGDTPSTTNGLGMVNVSDSVQGSLGSTSGDRTFEYNDDFTCPSDPAAYTNGVYTATFPNAATIVETNQSASAGVSLTCYAPSVSKTATTSLTRTYNWTIDKTATPETINMFRGDSHDVQYTISVVKTGSTDSNWAAAGVITVFNPHPTAAMTVSLSDSVTGDISATLACGGTLVVPANSSATCNYTVGLPDASTRTNTATASIGGLSVSGTAEVNFSGATVTEVNTSINVDDLNAPQSYPFSSTGSVSYDGSFDCDADEGQHTNTATIRETNQSDTATVTVNCYELSVTKNANTAFTREWDWNISKIGDQTALTLELGQQFLVNYDVVVSVQSVTDSAHVVSGTIAVNNPAPIAAMINSVNDILAPGGATTVNCGVSFPYSLTGGGTLNCTYSGGTGLTTASAGTNTATASLQNYEYDSAGVGTASGTSDFSGTAAYSFVGATVAKIDECINVTDDRAGTLGQVCAGQAPKTFEYTLNVGPYATCGTYSFTNTASFTSSDENESASHTVAVDVPCGGCTLTQGYWKTHSDRGPAPYDDGWKAIGALEEDTLFFNSTRTWYTVVWTPPAGNAYFNLAHQYMAAKLNVLNGAATTPAVVSALSQAEALFNAQGINDVTLTRAERTLALQLASTLDQYNNGLIGPGHCDEQNS